MRNSYFSKIDFLQPYCGKLLLTFASVKFRTLIFTCYLLILAVYPCTDGGACADVSVSQHADADHLIGEHRHADDKQGEQCSPLCICSCCAAGVNLVSSEVILFENTHHTLHIIPYTERHWLDNFHAIWQPPRLV